MASKMSMTHVKGQVIFVKFKALVLTRFEEEKHLTFRYNPLFASMASTSLYMSIKSVTLSFKMFCCPVVFKFPLVG